MRSALFAGVAALMIVALPAQAKKEGHGNPHAQGSKGGGAEESVSISISAGISVGGARDIARDVGIRPGSYQALPPGMQNRLAKGKPLPPGIAKKQVDPRMLSRLPVHAGHEWLVIGVDLVLVNIQTKIPVDILPGVF